MVTTQWRSCVPERDNVNHRLPPAHVTESPVLDPT
jgi:hypothetical protein